ncbi:MAG: hypothetical protein AB7F59_05265 [Bdellovibrionales bacterium]
MLQGFLFICTVLFANFSWANDFTYRELTTLIQSQNVKTVDALIPLLPAVLRQNHVLVHGSRSRQTSSLMAPRVILFTKFADFRPHHPTSGLALAFNGGGEAMADHSVEVIEYNPQVRGFELHEITFDKAGVQAPQFSGTNPSRCLMCHRADPRPNWDSYPFWPGVYGSIHTPPALPRLSIGQEEINQYLQFKADTSEHPRYKSLNLPADIKQLALNNTFMGLGFAYQNYGRVRRQIDQTNLLPKYKYYIQGLFAGCLHPRGFLPARIHAQLQSKLGYSLEEMYMQTEQRILLERTREQAFFDLYNKVHIIAALRFIFEGQGIDIADWSISMDSNYRFSTGNRGIGDFPFYLEIESMTKDCDELKRLSLAEFP